MIATCRLEHQNDDHRADRDHLHVVERDGASNDEANGGAYGAGLHNDAPPLRARDPP
ncbi:hypothetical protein [Bradyrhizobium sp. HKCCYLRH3061]|uniref:hypothetical protein n=1 Tax=Bradyrhizobium sp. HKCCYLRH3061 TaxID=3420734 RepID=UPI003EC0F741